MEADTKVRKCVYKHMCVYVVKPFMLIVCDRITPQFINL